MELETIKIENCNEEDDTQLCCICTEGINDTENVIQLQCCKTLIHDFCLESLFNHNESRDIEFTYCPLCRCGLNKQLYFNSQKNSDSATTPNEYVVIKFYSNSLLYVCGLIYCSFIAMSICLLIYLMNKSVLIHEIP